MILSAEKSNWRTGSSGLGVELESVFSRFQSRHPLNRLDTDLADVDLRILERSWEDAK